MVFYNNRFSVEQHHEKYFENTRKKCYIEQEHAIIFRQIFCNFVQPFSLVRFYVDKYLNNERFFPQVDPSKKTSGNIESNKENLKAFVEKAWTQIMCSACLFPR